MIDVYLCDNKGVPQTVITGASEIIVTERVYDHDDFQIVSYDRKIFDQIQNGSYLRFSVCSSILFENETVKATKSREGEIVYRFEGRSVTHWLERLPALTSLEPLKDYDGVVDSNSMNIFGRVIVDPVIEFPKNVEYKRTEIWAPKKNIKYNIPRKDKWSVVKELCTTYHAYVKSTKIDAFDEIVYEVFPIRNKTGTPIEGFDHIPPKENAEVIFSYRFNDFVSEELLRSNKNYVNIAAVFTDNTATIMHRSSRFPTGHNARVMIHDESGKISPDSVDVRTAIEYERSYARLKAETILNENKEEMVISVELSPKILAQYGKTYEIGDVIGVDLELLPGNKILPMLVSEYTHSFNDSGHTAYPTLSELSNMKGYTIQ